MTAKHHHHRRAVSGAWERRALTSCLCVALAAQAGAAGAQETQPPLRDPSLLPQPVTLKDRPLQEYARRAAPIDVRDAADYADNYADDIGDALFFAPGVWVNALDLKEPRISLRGFAVSNRQERSNAAVFRDGAPLTDVHGTTNVQEVDLLAVSRVEVMRGGGGDLRMVGDNLGGAVNFVSPTGLTARGGRTARLDAGASIEGTPGGRIHVDAAGVSGSGNFDYYVSLTGGYETGFRDNNELNDAILNANFGYRITPTFSTRFFVEAVYSNLELAGGLTPAEADDDPSQAAPPITLGPLFPGGPIIEFADGAEDDNFGRDLFTGRVSNQTTFGLLGHDFEGGFYFTRRESETPQIDFIGVVEESGNEWGVRLAAGRMLKIFNMDASYRLGGSYAAGSQSSDRFENLDGDKGDQFVDTEQKSSNLTAFVEAALEPFRRLLIDFGAKFMITDREFSVDDGDFEELRFTGVAARGGAVYEISDDIQLFANVSRTYEPPSFSELISDNPADFNDLDEQDAFTYEAGLRGRLNERIGWDITYFNTDVENEIVTIDDPETNGIGDTLANIDSTSHKGFEVGLDIRLLPARQARTGRALTLRNVYGYNNFRFDDAGPLDDVDGNRLAGVPQHVYRGELRYDADGRWFVAANVQIAGGDFFADHENVVSVPTYTAVGFSAGLKLNERIELFASGENLTDADYAAGVVPVLSQTDQEARLFTPARRASVYGGLTYRF